MTLTNPFGWKHKLNKIGFILLLLCGILAAAGGNLLISPSAPTRPAAMGHTTQPGIIVLGDPALCAISGDLWRKEVERRFPYAVVLLAHGQDLTTGFYTFPAGTLQSGVPVEQEMSILKAEYPDRAVVILSCNPLHLAVKDHPGCWYSPANAWVIPDRNVEDGGIKDSIFLTLHDFSEIPFVPVLGARSRWADSPDTVGDVFELVEAR